MPLASLCLLPWLLAQAPPAPAPPGVPGNLETPGPKIGEEAPGFTATDQDGRERTLGSLMGPNGLMLVFFRSADW
jgi:hypothetical protein